MLRVVNMSSIVCATRGHCEAEKEFMVLKYIHSVTLVNVRGFCQDFSQILGDGRKVFYPPYQLFKQCLWTIFTCNNLVLIDFSKRIILCHSLISNFLLKSILSSLDWHIHGLTHTYLDGFPSAESLMLEQIVLVRK